MKATMKEYSEIGIQTKARNKLKFEYCYDSEIQFKSVKKTRLRLAKNTFRLTIEPVLGKVKLQPDFEDLDLAELDQAKNGGGPQRKDLSKKVQELMAYVDFMIKVKEENNEIIEQLSKMNGEKE